MLDRQKSIRGATQALVMPLNGSDREVQLRVRHLASQPGGECNCHGCKGNKNKLLAELNVLRLLQTQVTKHTTRVDAQCTGAGDSTPGMTDKIAGVSDEQEQVHVAVQKLQDELSRS